MNNLISEANREQEWLYLVNETLEGEKCIVPLLNKLIRSPVVQGNQDFLDELTRQRDEEVNHVRMFKNLVGSDKVQGSGYRSKLFAYIDGLQSVTQKLFAMQGMLEGYALGALRFRLKYIEDSRSEKTDALALTEELDHVTLSFDFFKYLQNEEGRQSKQQFLQTGREVNKILSSSFKGENIARVFQESFDVKLNDPSSIDATPIMTAFKSLSSQSVVKNRDLFYRNYQLVADA